MIFPVLDQRFARSVWQSKQRVGFMRPARTQLQTGPLIHKRLVYDFILYSIIHRQLYAHKTETPTNCMCVNLHLDIIFPPNMLLG